MYKYPITEERCFQRIEKVSILIQKSLIKNQNLFRSQITEMPS